MKYCETGINENVSNGECEMKFVPRAWFCHLPL